MNHQLARTNRHRRTGARGLIALAAIALIAGACSSGTANTTAATEAPAATTPAAAANVGGGAEPSPSTTQPSIAGQLLIEATPDFNGGQVVGPFEVAEGADMLGCEAGSFVDTEVSTGVRRLMTCESGDRTGTITVHFVPGDDPGPGDANGPWIIEAGTGDFAGLRGDGDFSVVFDDATRSGAETLSGDFVFGPSDADADGAATGTEDGVGETALDADFLAEQMKALTVPDGIGALMIAVVGDDETIWAADGASPDGSAPTPSDPFRVGSISKVFTSLTTLSLVDEGLVGLDDPVVDHVARVEVPRGVTVRDLLQHTSGIRSYTDEPGFFEGLTEDHRRIYSPEEMVGLVSDREAEFKPGTDVAYSNTNYIILGIMIEEITGQPFADVLRDRVVDPVGMPNTYLAGAEEGPEPFGAYSDMTDQLAPIDFDYTSIATSAWSAGAVVSSAEDLHRLFTSLYAGGIISPEMLDQMTANEDYGLGIALWGADKSLVGHGGGIPGYSSLAYYSPASGRTAFWASSSDALDFGGAVEAVAEALITAS